MKKIHLQNSPFNCHCNGDFWFKLSWNVMHFDSLKMNKPRTRYQTGTRFWVLGISSYKEMDNHLLVRAGSTLVLAGSTARVLAGSTAPLTRSSADCGKPSTGLCLSSSVGTKLSSSDAPAVKMASSPEGKIKNMAQGFSDLLECVLMFFELKYKFYSIKIGFNVKIPNFDTLKGYQSCK